MSTVLTEQLNAADPDADQAGESPGRIIGVFQTVDRGLWIVSLVSSALILCGLVLTVFGGTLSRWLDLPLAVPHQEIAGYLLAALAFMGLVAGFKEGFPRVSFLYDRYSRGLRLFVDLALMGMASVYSGVLTYFAWILVGASRRTGIITSGVLTQPLWILQSVMALGLTLFTVYLLNSIGLRVARQLIAGHGRGTNAPT